MGDLVRAAAVDADVLVVDDRSTDSSREIAAANGARVLQAACPGYDGALDTGLRKAFADGYVWVVTMDGDGEHDPALVARFREILQQGSPLVCGVRRRPQRVAEYIVAALGRMLFGTKDLLCGMKGYSRPVLERHFDSGAALAINMAPVIGWRRAGGAFVEVAVTGTPRKDRPRFARALDANRTILMAFCRATVQARPRRKAVGR